MTINPSQNIRPFEMKYLTILTVLSVFASIHCFKPKPLVINNPSLVQSWTSAAIDFDAIAWPQRDFVINAINSISNNNSITRRINHQCLKSLSTFRDGLWRRQRWAYKFLDSSSKGSNGLSFGYVSSLGDRRECLAIQVPLDHLGFNGRYCVVKVTPKNVGHKLYDTLRPVSLNVSKNGRLFDDYAEDYGYFYRQGLNFAICAPSTCQRKDLQTIVDHGENYIMDVI